MKKTSIFIALSSALIASSINIAEADKNPRRENIINQSSILSFNESIKNAKKSVVNISTTKTLKQRGLELIDHPLLREFFGEQFSLQIPNQKSTSLGSGVIIAKDGYIVTNNHVVEGADEVSVTLLDNQKEYKAKIIGADPDSDLAVIKIDANNLYNITFADSSKALEGDVVFAIGNPFGIGGSISQGIISALNKSGIGLNNYESFIQTDASINLGNSGGALVDSRGALVGINSAIISRSGGSNGIGFAIPSNMVKNISLSLIEKGHIKRGFLGVSISALSGDIKELYQNKKGALITDVSLDKPASKAGLKRGDLIIKINDIIIDNPSKLKNTIGSFTPHEKITITYERDKKIQEVRLKLEESSNQQQTNQILSGLKLITLDDNIKRRYNLSKQLSGVLVLQVQRGSKGDEFGFLSGDIIVQIEDFLVENINDLNEAIAKQNGKKFRIWINRSGYVLPLIAK